MVSKKNVDENALWLGVGLLKLGGTVESRALLREIERRVEAGASLEEALGNAPRRQKNDFGIEIIGPVVTFIVLEALKAFWSAYLKKLTEDLAADAANLTNESIRKYFLSQLEALPSKDLLAEIEARLDEEAGRQAIDVAEIRQMKAALRDPDLLAAALRG